ncbi:MAG: hypothetical protein PVI90_00135 [Desulfobacteraceae bacterium]
MPSRPREHKSPFDFYASQCNLPDDAYTLQKGNNIREDQFGTQALRFEGRGYQGTIVDINPDTQTYKVAISTGDGIATQEGIGRITQSMGDVRILPIGTRVALSAEFGELFIVGIMPYTGNRNNNENRISLTGIAGTGGEDPLYTGRTSAANYRTKNTPRDLGSNDWAEIGEEGNAVAVLAGGVNVVRSSGMAQIRTHLINDLVEIISRNYKHISDMGISEIKNNKGRITWSFRGGSDQATETGSDQENWSIRIDLGAEGDLFRFELTQPSGGTNFKFHVTADGQLSIFTAEASDEFVGTDKNIKILGDRTTSVKQNDEQTIEGNQTKNIYGIRNTGISNNDTCTVGNDRIINVQKHLIETVGGKHEEKIVGNNPITAKPGDIARETIINNGSWLINIGNPTSGANAVALAGFELNTFTGDIIQQINIKGNIDLKTLLGNASLETTSGIATLKTALGVANVDGTTVNLGPITTSMANPLVRGALHSAAFGSFTSTNIGAIKPTIAATSTLMGILAPPSGSILWPIGSVMANAFFSWITAVNACLNTLLASNTALASAVPNTLSTKCFTA